MNRAANRSFQNEIIKTETLSEENGSSRAFMRSHQKQTDDFQPYYKDKNFIALPVETQNKFVDALNAEREIGGDLHFASWNEKNNLSNYFSKSSGIKIPKDIDINIAVNDSDFDSSPSLR